MASSLDQIVVAHHDQARNMLNKTLRCNHNFKIQNGVVEIKRIGNKFTTNVERRLRKMEVAAEIRRIQKR